MLKLAFAMVATAALLGATIVSLGAGIARNSYHCIMSSGICGVAFFHYLSILMIRTKQYFDSDKETQHYSPHDHTVALLRCQEAHSIVCDTRTRTARPNNALAVVTRLTGTPTGS